VRKEMINDESMPLKTTNVIKLNKVKESQVYHQCSGAHSCLFSKIIYGAFQKAEAGSPTSETLCMGLDNRHAWLFREH
jgi:hypothetical protein